MIVLDERDRIGGHDQSLYTYHNGVNVPHELGPGSFSVDDVTLKSVLDEYNAGPIIAAGPDAFFVQPNGMYIHIIPTFRLLIVHLVRNTVHSGPLCSSTYNTLHCTSK